MPPAPPVLLLSRCRAAIVAVVFVLAAGLAGAKPVHFDVPAQSAATALVALAKQAGVEVLFSSADLKPVRGNAVVGSFEPEEALRLLLRGTGFVAERTASGKFIVVRERRAAAIVRGLIVDRTDGSPVAGAVVRFADSTEAVRSRYDGLFLLDAQPGSLLLVVQADGFRTLRVTDVACRPGERTDLGVLRLEPGADDPQRLGELVVKAEETDTAAPTVVSLDAFVVTPSRYSLEEERGPFAATLTQSDLVALPQLGEDLYRAISHLPGLAADDLTARFWVRGAPHEQVLARLDGVDLIEPFHLQDTESSLSVLDVETISRLDLVTGGFTAEAGDHLAGVLTMETDSYARAKPRTTLAASLTGVRAASRGQTASGRGRWLVSGRSGYPDLALKAAVSNGEIRPRYQDVMGKWEWRPVPDHVFSVHALHATDRMHLRDASGPILNSRYGSDYVWARWRGSFGKLDGESVVSLAETTTHRDAYGRLDNFYRLDLRERRDFQVGSARTDWSALLSPRLLLRAGLEGKAGAADCDFHAVRESVVVRDGAYQLGRVERNGKASPEGESFGGYVTARVQPIARLTLEPGVRFDGNTYADDRDVSPRLNAAWSFRRTTLRAAWGVYHQSEGLNRLPVSDGETTFRRSERAEHRILSLEHRLASGINLRLEGYERLVTRPQPHWENLVDTLDAVPEIENDRRQIVPVCSRARGLELIAERRASDTLTWSASYAFAKAVDELAGGVTIPRPRDQRHTIYLDANYTPNARWQFSIAGQFHTGWPITESRFALFPLSTGGSIVERTFGTPFDTRLPDYVRFDLRAQRRFELKRGTLRVYLDVFNALNRRNVINYAYTVQMLSSSQFVTARRAGDRLLPILPSIGAVWDF